MIIDIFFYTDKRSSGKLLKTENLKTVKDGGNDGLTLAKKFEKLNFVWNKSAFPLFNQLSVSCNSKIAFLPKNYINCVYLSSHTSIRGNFCSEAA